MSYNMTFKTWLINVWYYYVRFYTCVKVRDIQCQKELGE